MITRALAALKEVFIPKSEFEEVETQTSLLKKKAEHFKVECAVDGKKVPCSELNYTPYTGVPAPVETPTDSWFVNSSTEVIKTEKQLTHEQMLEEAARREEENRKEQKESEDIHQKMYEMATANWNTVAESQGGSENFQEGPGGWCSGTGYNQFRP